MDPDMDPQKHGMNVGLKNIYNLRELYFIKVMGNVICYLNVRLLTD